MTSVAVMWFRRDLRLADNAALTKALARADAVSCVCDCTPDPTGDTVSAGAASQAWRALSLRSLDADLRERQGGLKALRGSVGQALLAEAHAHGAKTVHCTRDWTPAALAEEDRVRETLAAAGIQLVVDEGSLLVTPDSMRASNGSAYRIFTHYYRAWEHTWHASVPPLEAPDHVPAPARVPEFVPPGGDSAAAVAAHRMPGERAAAARLCSFVTELLEPYDDARNLPGTDGTSRLSAALTFGELTTRQIALRLLRDDCPSESKRVYLRQLGWRAYAYHVLYHAPTLAEEPWHEEFAAMPWNNDAEAFEAWKCGRTGYPLVDAGMRQLLETGWMHGRARLVAGSFLTKDLLIPWQMGQAWFWENLVDADPALNPFNWQWVAGSGADAAPYFRIFNPVRQGERFDPTGAYVRKWVPELSALPNRWIHRPWEAPAAQLESAGVKLGVTYPRPIVDHQEARMRALAAYEHIQCAAGKGV